MKNASLRALSCTTFACFTLLAAASAHAENKLFPTDVLAQGQFDGSLSLSRVKTNYDTVVEQERRNDEIGVNVRAGLGARTHMGLSLASGDVTERVPYYAYEGSADYTGLQLSLRHALIERGDYTLVIDGAFTRLNFDTPGVADDINFFTLGMSAGFKLSSDARAAVTVKADIADDDDANDVYTIAGGLWISVTPSVTIVPSLAWSKVDGNQNGDIFTLGLKADVALDRNTYLSPSISYSPEDDANATRTGIGISLYHLF